MDTTFFAIEASGVLPTSLIWFEQIETLLVLMGAVGLGSLAVLCASILANRRMPQVVWPRHSATWNKKAIARG